ncbi:hypothetical protein ACLB2K_020997 [Fragaria x ananassa]
MASKNTQAISTKKSKPTTSRSSSESSGHVTRSMARNQLITFVALPSKPHKPIITLENLRENKHVSRSEERETLKKPKERLSSPTLDDESSTTSYHGSSNGDENNTYDMPSDDSSQPIHMQVMVTCASTIEEKIPNLMGMVEKLTKTVEEKDMQVAELYSRLENQDEEKKEKVGENSNH